MVDELIEDLGESFFLISLDFEVDVPVTVLGLTECHLVEELGFLQRPPVRRNYLLNEFLSQVGSRFVCLPLLQLPVFLRFLLKVPSVVKVEHLLLVDETYGVGCLAKVRFLLR